MSQRLKSQFPFLQMLARSQSQRRKELLKTATREELLSLFEICLNILNKKLPVKGTTYKRFYRHRQLIRALGDRKVSFTRKKKLVNQHGGFIGQIASIALPLIAGLLTGR